MTNLRFVYRISMVAALGGLLFGYDKGLGGAFTFWLFMVFAIIFLIFVWRSVPGTKQKTLEEIEQSWSQ